MPLILCSEEMNIQQFIRQYHHCYQKMVSDGACIVVSQPTQESTTRQYHECLTTWRLDMISM